MFHFCTAHFQRKTMMNRGLDSDLHTKEISLKKLYLDIYYVCIYIWIGEYKKRTYASSNRAMSKTIIEFVVLNYFYLQNYIFLIH